MKMSSNIPPPEEGLGAVVVDITFLEIIHENDGEVGGGTGTHGGAPCLEVVFTCELKIVHLEDAA